MPNTVTVPRERRAISMPTGWFEKANLSQREVAEALDLKVGTFTSWIYTTYPSFPYAVWLAMVERWGDHGYRDLPLTTRVSGSRLPPAFAKYMDGAAAAQPAQPTPPAPAVTPTVARNTITYSDPATWPAWFMEAMQLQIALVANAVGARHELQVKQGQLADELVKLAGEIDTERKQKEAALDLAMELDEKVRRLEADLACRSGQSPTTEQAVTAVQALAAVSGAAGKAIDATDLRARLGK